MDFAEPKPLTGILEQIDAKTPVGSAMRSADWAAMPQEIRDSAFFSAGVTDARFLSAQQQALRDMIARARQKNDAGVEMWKMDRGQFVAQLRQMGEAMGVKHPDGRKGGVNEKDITDPISVARLKLVVNTQLEMAYGQGQYLTAMDPDILSEWPAWELVRITPRKVPRNWLQRWTDAGGVLHDGRMIALKTDPIWTAISRFGKPHPPFDYNSGMGVEEVDADTAESYGLMLHHAQPQSPAKLSSLDDGLQASVADLDPAYKSRLSQITDGKVKVSGDTAEWVPQDAQEHADLVKVRDAKPVPPTPPEAVIAKAYTPPKPPGSQPPPPLTLRKQTKQDAALAFQREFGCAVVFNPPAGPDDWGERLSEKEAIKHLQTVAGEWKRMQAAFKGLEGSKVVHTFYCTHSETGLATVDGPAPGFATKAKEFKPMLWMHLEDWQHVNKRPWQVERRGSQVVDNFRHELAHCLSTDAVLDAFKADVLTHLDLEWFRQNVSEYAATSQVEAIAEAFALCTRADYVQGTLPPVLEHFIVETMLGGRI